MPFRARGVQVTSGSVCAKSSCSMRQIKVGSAILNQTPFDWDNNKANILTAVREAKQRGVSLLCLPELCLSGYGCEDAFFSSALQREALGLLPEIAAASSGIAVALGLPLLFEGHLFNAACLLADGRIAGFVCKQFLANEGIHYEPRWFKPWIPGRRGNISIGGRTYPVGDLCFACGDVKIGFEICEDAWAPNRPGRRLAERGVDVILNPSASHFAFGKFEVRKHFILEGSRAFGVSYVYSNLVGNEAGRAIYDGGSLIASGGQLIAAGPRLIYSNVHVTAATVDIDSVRLARARGPAHEYAADAAADGVVDAGFCPAQAKPELNQLGAAGWETGAYVKEEEFAKVVALGLFDYMRKSRSNGFVVSLSGGCDSSAVSCLIRLMAEFAMIELGRDGILAKLSYIPGIAQCAAVEDLMPKLLTCLYQGTEHSSAGTRAAARSVARAIGAGYAELEVGELVGRYTALVEQGLALKFSWEKDDIAMQNIQARVRGPAAWLAANVKNALLLATSNRSEAAVGYTTMDGDTCGGLSPIAGIDKAFLRQWLRWLERVGPSGIGPIGELSLVNAQEPTAELRPNQAHQTDESDLMPYEVLDVVERHAIRDKKSPEEVFALVQARFPRRSAEDLRLWVDRFFRLWCRNQWKRERYAPCFHLDDENLDPKTWCRFPILSGGFAGELQRLRLLKLA